MHAPVPSGVQEAQGPIKNIRLSKKTPLLLPLKEPILSKKKTAFFFT
jgi:hypothetical protein